MDHTTGADDPAEHARRVALDAALPAWAVTVRDALLDGDVSTLEVLERLLDAAPWLFAKGRAWLVE